MKLTEIKLVEKLNGMTNGQSYISEVDGKEYKWTYRVWDDSHGMNGYCVCEPNMADTILFDDFPGYKIIIDSDNRPNLDNLNALENRLFGIE